MVDGLVQLLSRKVSNQTSTPCARTRRAAASTSCDWILDHAVGRRAGGRPRLSPRCWPWQRLGEPPWRSGSRTIRTPPVPPWTKTISPGWTFASRTSPRCAGDRDQPPWRPRRGRILPRASGRASGRRRPRIRRRSLARRPAPGSDPQTRSPGLEIFHPDRRPRPCRPARSRRYRASVLPCRSRRCGCRCRSD